MKVLEVFYNKLFNLEDSQKRNKIFIEIIYLNEGMINSFKDTPNLIIQLKITIWRINRQIVKKIRLQVCVTSTNSFDIITVYDTMCCIITIACLVSSNNCRHLDESVLRSYRPLKKLTFPSNIDTAVSNYTVPEPYDCILVSKCLLWWIPHFNLQTQ